MKGELCYAAAHQLSAGPTDIPANHVHGSDGTEPWTRQDERTLLHD
jgi:hypothetical protein